MPCARTDTRHRVTLTDTDTVTVRVKSAALRYIFSWVDGCLGHVPPTVVATVGRALLICPHASSLCFCISLCVRVCVSVTTFAAVSVAYAPVSFAHMRRAAFDN